MHRSVRNRYFLDNDGPRPIDFWKHRCRLLRHGFLTQEPSHETPHTGGDDRLDWIVGRPKHERSRELQTRHHPRRRPPGRTGLEVHLRPVHRAPGAVHLRRHLGRDARRSQVLFPDHVRLRPVQEATGYRAAGRRCFALGGRWRRRLGRHGRRGFLCRRAHAANLRGQRYSAARSWPGGGQEIRGPPLDQADGAEDRGDGHSGVGRRAAGARDDLPGNPLRRLRPARVRVHRPPEHRRGRAVDRRPWR